MEIGNAIRNLRTESGMSQEELAGKVFVSRQAISNWENGKFYPDVQSLAFIADIFGTSIDDLVKGDLPMMEIKAAEQNARLVKRDAVIYTALLAVALVVVIVAFSLGNWLALAAGALTVLYGEGCGSPIRERIRQPRPHPIALSLRARDLARARLRSETTC